MGYSLRRESQTSPSFSFKVEISLFIKIILHVYTSYARAFFFKIVIQLAFAIAIACTSYARAFAFQQVTSTTSSARYFARSFAFLFKIAHLQVLKIFYFLKKLC